MFCNLKNNFTLFTVRQGFFSYASLVPRYSLRYSSHTLKILSPCLQKASNFLQSNQTNYWNNTNSSALQYFHCNYSTTAFSPENVSETKSSINPLSSGLFGNPGFHSPESIREFAQNHAIKASDLVNRILEKSHSFDHSKEKWQLQDTVSLIDLFDSLSNTICLCTDAAEVIRNLHPDPFYIDAAESVYALLSSMVHTLNTRTELYTILAKAVKLHASQLTPMQLRNAQVFLRDFELAGIHLSDQHREQYASLSNEINIHMRDFLTFPFPKLKLSLTEPEFSHVATNSRIKKIPPSSSISNITKEERKSSDIINLQLTYQEAQQLLCGSDIPSVRKKVFDSIHDPHPQQEVNLMNLLTKRHKLANLLGYSSYADWFLQDKMLNTPEKVFFFLNSEAKKLMPNLKLALKCMRALYMTSQKDPLKCECILQPWDVAYYHSSSRMLSKTSFWSTTRERAFTVFQRLIKELYNVDFKSVPCALSEVWDSSVTKWMLTHPQKGVLGTLYCDDRAQSSSSLNQAAHFTVQCKSTLTQGLGVVVIRLPYQLSYGGHWQWHHVETLFHELGHAMHALLSFTPYQNTSGTRCTFDLGEVPSILMEFLATDLSTRVKFEDVAPPPSAALTWDLAQQLLSSIYDLSLHASWHPNISIPEWLHMLHTSPESIFGSSYPSLNAFLQCMPWSQGMHPHLRFQHLGTYASGYYSYLWCRQLAECIYQKLFLNQESKWHQAGELLWKEFLGWGGGRDPWECMGAILNERDRDTLFQNICERQS